ncbi:MAG: dimethylargininase [Pseudomonadota bacterium]|nr:dimethylargininase [Pseudomonadota bacterium]
MPLAFTRQVSPRIVECALTHLDRQPIDPDRAAVQHAGYEQALRDAGYDVIRLPYLPDDPDAVFVEDTAILLGDHAIITRPGTPARAGETRSTAEGLGAYFAVRSLAAGTLDGGDVLRIGKTLYVGQSSRTDAAGSSALEEVVARLGYRVVPVELGRCLHLKTAVTYAGIDREGRPTLLVNPDWVDPSLFPDTDPLTVADGEPFAANVVRARDRLIMAAGSPGTAAKLRERGFVVVEVDLSDLQKAEAGGTCMSLLSD